jgi:hypothetical protein
VDLKVCKSIFILEGGLEIFSFAVEFASIDFEDQTSSAEMCFSDELKKHREMMLLEIKKQSRDISAPLEEEDIAWDSTEGIWPHSPGLYVSVDMIYHLKKCRNLCSSSQRLFLDREDDVANAFEDNLYARENHHGK